VAAITVWLAEKLVQGSIEHFGRGIEERHLQTGPEGIVPHVFGGMFTDDLVPRRFADGGRSPGVIHHRFAEADDPGVERDFADLEEGPVGDFALHVPGGDGAQRQIDPSGLDGFHVMRHVLLTLQPGDDANQFIDAVLHPDFDDGRPIAGEALMNQARKIVDVAGGLGVRPKTVRQEHEVGRAHVDRRCCVLRTPGPANP